MLVRLAYVAVWTLAAGIWSLAAAAGANRSPLAALPYDVLQMGVAGRLGVGVIWLTRQVALTDSRITLVAVHILALAGYAVVYATGFVWPELVAGDVVRAVHELTGSPIVPWNLLMGSWLYLVIAELTYAAGTHRRATAAAARWPIAHRWPRCAAC